MMVETYKILLFSQEKDIESGNLNLISCLEKGFARHLLKSDLIWFGLGLG